MTDDIDHEMWRAFEPLREVEIGPPTMRAAPRSTRTTVIAVAASIIALLIVGVAQFGVGTSNTDVGTTTPPSSTTPTSTTSTDDATEERSTSACGIRPTDRALPSAAASPQELADAADIVLSGQVVAFEGSTTFTIKAFRDELGGTALPLTFRSTPLAISRESPFFDVVAFLVSEESGYEVLPGGLWAECPDGSAKSVNGDPQGDEWDGIDSLDAVVREVWASQRGASELVGTMDTDGMTTVSRVVLVDGSEFLLRLPASEGTRFTLTQAINGDELAQLSSKNLTARINLGFCTEVNEQNVHGTLSSVVRDGLAIDLTLCRPDEFVRLEVDRTTDTSLDPNDFDLVPLVGGDSYQAWMSAQGFGRDECCFDRRFVNFDEILVLSNGQLNSVVRAHDRDTLTTLWSVDLRELIDSESDWLGDAGFLWGQTQGGLTLATTGHGYLLALDPTTGAKAWQLDLDGRSPSDWSDTQDGDLIITSEVQSEGDQTAPVVQRIDSRTGEVVWTAAGRERTDLQWNPPAILGDLVLVVDVSSFPAEPADKIPSAISAYDLSTGELRWVTTLDDTTEAFTEGTIIIDSTRTPQLLLVRTVGGILFRLNPDSGAELWRTTIPAHAVVGLAPDAVTVEDRAGDQFDFSLDDGTLAN